MAVPLPFIWADIVVQTKYRQCKSRVYGALATNITTQAGLDLVAHDFSASLAPKILDILSQDCTYVGVGVRFQNIGIDLESFSGTGSDTGNITSEALPDEVAAEIQKRTGLSGRDKRGRYFFSGVPEDGNKSGLVVDPLKTNLATLSNWLGSDVALTSNTWHMRHFDRKTNTLIPITQCRPVQAFASRRDRRKPLELLSY